MVEEEPVPLLCIGDLLDEQGVLVADYLNIRVNGAEIKVLEGLGDLDRVKVIDVAAYYGQDGRPNADVVRQILRERGCEVLRDNGRGRIAFWRVTGRAR